MCTSHRRPDCSERRLMCVEAMHGVALNRNITMPSNIDATEIGDAALPCSNLDRGPTQQREGAWGLLPRDRIVARCVGRNALTMSQDHNERDQRASRTTNGEDLSAFRGNKLIPPANHGSGRAERERLALCRRFEQELHLGPECRALRSRGEVRDPLGSETGTLGERDALTRALVDPLKEVRLRCSCRAGT